MPTIPQMLLNQFINSSNIKNNPMANNLLNAAQSGNFSEIEQFGRNIAKERGVDFDTEFRNFRNRFSK